VCVCVRACLIEVATILITSGAIPFKECRCPGQDGFVNLSNCAYRFIMASWKLMGANEVHLEDIHKALESSDEDSPKISVCRDADWRDDVAAIEEHLKQYIWEIPTSAGFIFSRSADHIVESWLQFQPMQDVWNWLPIKSVSTPASRRIRRSFHDFERLSQECWYLPHDRNFFWVQNLSNVCYFFQKGQLLNDDAFGIGRVVDIFRCEDGVAPGIPPSQFPVFVNLEFGEFSLAANGCIERRPSASFRKHVLLSSLHLLPANVTFSDASEGMTSPDCEQICFRITSSNAALQGR